MKNSEDKLFYQKKMEEELIEVGRQKSRPTLFLHCCCGPCLTYPLSILVEYFDVTVGFFNPNIQPKEEYEKRLNTVKQFISEYAKDVQKEIPLVINEEDFQAYENEFKGRSESYEGGPFCLKCHAYRMELAYKYAHLHNFDYFTTVMTVSCKKPSRELNEIAYLLEKKYHPTKYLYSDFKKKNGQQIGIEIAKKYNLYRQNYCGCLPSKNERKVTQ